MTAQSAMALQTTRESVFIERIRQKAILQERSRIARELHDSLGQTLTAIILQIAVAETSFARPEIARTHVGRALQLASNGLKEMRSCVHGLHPKHLGLIALKDAITRISEDLTNGTALHVQLSFQGMSHRLSADIETALLRTSQEALTNIARHAHARQARIRLQVDARQARLSIDDDGRVFKADRQPAIRGFGLVNMRQRITNLGGSLFLRSQLGRGTKVVAVVPRAASRM